MNKTIYTAEVQSHLFKVADGEYLTIPGRDIQVLKAEGFKPGDIVKVIVEVEKIEERGE